MTEHIGRERNSTGPDVNPGIYRALFWPGLGRCRHVSQIRSFVPDRV